MPQQDKIKREIDRIGLMLAKLLSMVLSKNYENPEVNAAFVQQFNEELDEFLALNNADDIALLINENKFTIDNLRHFGNLLYELAQRTNDQQNKEQLLKKALRIYEYVNANSGGTMYLDVEYRLKELRDITS